MTLCCLFSLKCLLNCVLTLLTQLEDGCVGVSLSFPPSFMFLNQTDNSLKMSQSVWLLLKEIQSFLDINMNL